MSQTAEETIAELVQSFLDKHQLETFRLEVDAQGIRQEDDWWYVTVVPDRNGVRAHDYAERLTEVEQRLRDERSVNVLLVPTLVGD